MDNTEQKPERIKYGRHKPGWGRVFSEDCPYQDDPIYWKLYDLIMLRDPRAIFKDKTPHRAIHKGRFKNGADNEGEA